ncbi:hypothetical protein ACQ86E_01465 [Bradyrhizobium betae]|uniref:hypothetical protein n=1 Tax=Bradyrhizobium betae TaxID=244734 RepID=UPI003D67E140
MRLHPFETDEGTERAEHPEPDVARTRARAAETGQEQPTEHGESEKGALIVTDQNAARTQGTESIQRHRQIGIGKPGAFQILDDVGIKSGDMRIDRRAIDPDVPAIFDIEHGIVGEIAEHQQRGQCDQAGEPDVRSRRHVGDGLQPSCCTGEIGHNRIPCLAWLLRAPMRHQARPQWTGWVADLSPRCLAVALMVNRGLPALRLDGLRNRPPSSQPSTQPRGV